MFTKLSDWRKRELGNRVPNALRAGKLVTLSGVIPSVLKDQCLRATWGALVLQ
jgi:hypothetical protein